MENHGTEGVWISVGGSKMHRLDFDQWCDLDRRLDAITERLQSGDRSFRIAVDGRVVAMGEREDGIMSVW